jgi:hypothetical protein
MSLMGTINQDRDKKPLMAREDSSIKKAMKGVLKLGRKNMPKMPSIMRKAEGM